MGTIFFGIPIAIFLIFSIFIFVKFSNSNKHLDNMDTQSKLELERLKKEVIEKIKNKNNSNSKVSYNELLNESKKNEKDIIELQNIIKNYHNKKYNEVDNKKNNTSNSRLSFSKENLLRGIIAREYLDRRKR